jgi:hypothetical protein
MSVMTTMRALAFAGNVSGAALFVLVSVQRLNSTANEGGTMGKCDVMNAPRGKQVRLGGELTGRSSVTESR